MAKEEGLNITVPLPATDQDKDSSFISPELKASIANYFTTAQPFGSAIGAGVGIAVIGLIGSGIYFLVKRAQS